MLGLVEVDGHGGAAEVDGTGLGTGVVCTMVVSVWDSFTTSAVGDGVTTVSFSVTESGKYERERTCAQSDSFVLVHEQPSVGR